MKNWDLAKILNNIADLMEILGEDGFRIISYRKAARAIEDLPSAIEDIAAAGKLLDVPGIGKSMAVKVEQFLATGKIDRHQELLAKVPATLPELLSLPGTGPKTALKLWKGAGITSIAELERAMESSSDALSRIEGLGPKKMRQLWEGISFIRSVGGRIRLGEADAVAAELALTISKIPGAQRVQAAGSLRRGKDTIGDVDLLCAATAQDAPAIIKGFVEARPVQRVTAAGATKASVVLAREVQADLRVVPPESFGAALAYFTGSKDHNVKLRELAVKKGWKLNEYGLFDGDRAIAGSDEEGIYAKLGLQFVPPELREDRGEIDAALAGTLPAPVEATDIRGDLHMHTDASDGANTIEEMIDACRNRGYKYMAICDHSKTQVQANGLDEKRLALHVEAIRKAAKKHKDILVLAGIEVDIIKDGRLDFENDVLAELDFVTASCHSALTMGREEATPRLIRACEHPLVRCIGHPTARVINSRPGMEIDIDEVARAAAANRVALEINSNYLRLDLRDVHVRAAIKQGARIAINTDAHSADELDMIRYGVLTARRGWATAADVVNTMTVEKLTEWIGKKRS